MGRFAMAVHDWCNCVNCIKVAVGGRAGHFASQMHQEPHNHCRAEGMPPK